MSIVLVISLLAVCLGTSKLVRPLAIRGGFVDLPGGRKNHSKPTPVIGGIVVYIGIIFGYVVTHPPSFTLLLIVLCSGSLLLLGMLDDKKNLSAKYRFNAELLIAIGFLSASGAYVSNTGILPGGVSFEVPTLGFFISLIALVGLTNAFNMMDGLDGLAGAMVAVALAGVVAFSILFSGSDDFTVFCCVVGVSVAAFLRLNLSSSSDRQIFLGDGGSLMLGFAIAAILIGVIDQSESPAQFSAVDALWCVAVPLADLIAVMIRRTLKGQLVFSADRTHIHHILQRIGFSKVTSLLILVLISIASVLTGLILKALAPSISFAVFLVFVFAWILLNLHAWKFVRLARRLR